MFGGSRRLVTAIEVSVASSLARPVQVSLLERLPVPLDGKEPGVEVVEATPIARGGYAVFTRAFDPALQPLLARGTGRVVFAGAHTSTEFQGYMNGAVESGQRAAEDIGALERMRPSSR